MPFVDRAARPRRPREPENSGRGRERERDSGDPGTARVCARGGGGVPGRGLDVCVGGRGGEGGSRRHGGGLGALPAAGARRRSRPAGCRRGRPGYRPPLPRRAAGPGPLALRRPSRQGASRVVGPDAGPGPPLLVRPLAVQVPSAFRRGGLKTPWGVSPVRPWVGGRRARRRGSSVGRGPDPSRRLAPHGLRPLAGAAPRARRRRRAPRRPSGGGFTRRPSSCRRPRAARVSCACPAPCGGGNPRAPVGCPRSPRRGRRAGLPVEVKPSDPSPESGPVILVSLAGLRQPPLGACRARRASRCRERPRHIDLVRLLAVDHSARASMKNAASCEN